MNIELVSIFVLLFHIRLIGTTNLVTHYFHYKKLRRDELITRSYEQLTAGHHYTVRPARAVRPARVVTGESSQ